MRIKIIPKLWFGVMLIAATLSISLTSAPLAPPYTAATNLSPDGTANINYSAAIILSWDAATGGTAPYNYSVNIYSDVSLSNMIHTSGNLGTDTWYTLPANTLTPNTTYYWVVESVDSTTTTEVSASASIRTMMPQPVLVSPVDNAIPSSRRPTLNWNMANNTTGVTYDFVFDLNGSSQADLPGITSGGNTSFTFPFDLPYGEYNWQIRANDGVGGNPSTISVDTFSFKIIISPLMPYNGLTGVSVEPTLVWQDASANSYTIEMSEDATFNTGVFSTLVAGGDTTYTFSETDANYPLSNNTKYYWRIKYDLGSSSFTTAVYHFTTIPQVTVDLNFPMQNDEVSIGFPTMFSWSINQNQGSLQYKVQVKTSSNTPTPAEWITSDFNDTTATRYKHYSLVGGSTYHWRVVVLNASLETVSYSAPVMFTTSGGAVVPTASWPSGGDTVYTNTPTLYWYLGGWGVDLSYDIEIDDDPAFGSVDYSLTNITDFYHTLNSALTPGTTYFWRVRSVYKRGTADEQTSAYSASVQFTTRGTGTPIVPTNSYPVGNAMVYSTSPYLYWYLGAPGNGLVYNIDIEPIGSGLDGVADYSSVVATSHQVSGLTPGETYVWAVQSDNNTTTSGWSAVDTFTVTGGANSYPVVNWPVGNPVVYTAQPTLSWYLEGSTAGVAKYTVAWKEGSPSANWLADNDGQADINDANTTTYTYAANLNYGSTYFWAVASHDGSTYSNWSEGSFTVVGGNSAQPIVSNPAGGETIYSNDVYMSWYVNTSDVGIQGYEVVYSNSDVFAPEVTTTVSAATIANKNYTATNLTAGATYYWKVRAWYGGGNYSPYSAIHNFYVFTGSDAPIQPIAGGPDKISLDTEKPVLTWFLPQESNTTLNYVVTISENADLSDPVEVIHTNNTNAEAENLSKDKLYYWNVRSVDGNNEYSYYSNRANFGTGRNVTDIESEVDETIPDSYSLAQNYPNPFNPATTIKFSLPETSHVKIDVYNLLGEKIASLLNGEIKAGVHKVKFNASNLASGVYLYKISAGEFNNVKKMILLK